MKKIDTVSQWLKIHVFVKSLHDVREAGGTFTPSTALFNQHIHVHVYTTNMT